MPWNNTTKKIVGAANINANGDIQKATGQSYRNIGNCIKYGCLGGIVNKFSLVKPIHYPGKFKLSLEDFRGTPTMINSGIVFGLEVPANYSNPNPSAIHATSWNYVGYPNASGMETMTGGKSQYRFFDFIHPDTTPSEQTLVGYSQNAVPDLSGEIPSTSEFHIGSSKSESAGYSVVNALYDPNNTEGVRIAEFIVRTSAGEVIDENTLKERLANCYPGILIGNYVTALTHASTDTALPLWHNNAWTSDNWYVDMSKVLGKTNQGGTAGRSPWSSDTNTTASLVLIYPATAGSTYIAAGDPETDVAQYWVYLATDLAWYASFFPIPGATGVSVSLTRITTATVANVTAITKTSTGFTVSYKFTANYTGFLSTTITAVVNETGQSVTFRKAKTTSRSSASSASTYSESFGWSADFDLVPFPGQSYEVTVTIFTTIGGRDSYGNGMQETITI